MRAGLVVGDLRVQTVVRRDGRRSFTIVDAARVMVEAADGFLRLFEGSGTQRTYAVFLVDHLRWLARQGLAAESVRLEDLIRYMGAAGAKPGGLPAGQGRAGGLTDHRSLVLVWRTIWRQSRERAVPWR
jgi:hypothetical protein